MAIKQVTFKQMLLILIKLVTVMREKTIILPREKNDFRIKSTSFKSGGKIPKKFTPHGQDVHPDFYWTGIPKHTKSFAIICDDPDTPSGKVFTHWVVKNIPLSVTKIEEGEQVGEEIKIVGDLRDIQGRNRLMIRHIDISLNYMLLETKN